MSPENGLRHFCVRIVTSAYFDPFILVLIILSSILLAIDNPLDDPESDRNQALAIVDLIITILFFLEAALKIITYGFLMNGPFSYLRNGWNILDFMIVTLSVVSLSLGDSGKFGKLKALRTFRVLRPLRLISRNENLKLVIDSLLRSIPSIGNVMLICLFFFLIFGIICVNYFKG
jgi:voltage-dependent calcium channel L type alpha-1D